MQLIKMALWRVLDNNKRLATLAVKHPPRPNKHNEKDKPRNRRKSKAAAKIGRRGKPLAHARIFLRRRDPCFFLCGDFSFGGVIRTAFYTPLMPCRCTFRSPKLRFLPTFCKPLQHRNFSCGVL